MKGELADCYAVLGIDAEATDQEIRSARRRAAWAAHPDRGGSHTAMATVNAAFVEIMRARNSACAERAVGPQRIHNDIPSFTVNVLPVEAFEYLILAAKDIGEIVDSDPPYVLEVMLHSTGTGMPMDHVVSDHGVWCRVDVVPDAGSSTVSLWCEGDAEACRDRWVQAINALGDQQLL
ncbi:MAG: DnaJ domain-containing protein [Ilumatobacteraceae bacterium]